MLWAEAATDKSTNMAASHMAIVLLVRTAISKPNIPQIDPALV